MLIGQTSSGVACCHARTLRWNTSTTLESARGVLDEHVDVRCDLFAQEELHKQVPKVFLLPTQGREHLRGRPMRVSPIEPNVRRVKEPPNFKVLA